MIFIGASNEIGQFESGLTAQWFGAVPAVVLGYSGGTSLVIKDLVSLKLSDIKAAHEAWLPDYMNATE